MPPLLCIAVDQRPQIGPRNTCWEVIFHYEIFVLGLTPFNEVRFSWKFVQMVNRAPASNTPIFRPICWKKGWILLDNEKNLKKIHEWWHFLCIEGRDIYLVYFPAVEELHDLEPCNVSWPYLVIGLCNRDLCGWNGEFREFFLIFKN